MLDHAPAIAFRLNGEEQRLAVDLAQSLATTLRDDLALTGTKIGCDAGDCGACTVLVDGAQACACLIATGQVDGATIETIESADPLIARLQAAFLIHGAAQCGICTPGMIMAAADCLKRNPAADAREIEAALGGVLCRCTGYLKIVEAILSLRDAAPPTEEPGSVGARIARLDGAPKVTGKDIFGADSAPANALWLRVIRSPHHHASFTFGDLDAFRSNQPGLEAVLTAADIPGKNAYGIFPAMRDQPVLAENIARYRGEPVLALVGTKSAIDRISDRDCPITWTPLAPLVTPAAALSGDAIHTNRPGNILTRGYLKKGEGAAGHAGDVVTVGGSFSTGFVEHAYIEPEAGFAEIVDGRIEISACTQAPYMDLDETSHVMGMPADRIRIRPTACGGGFGGKLDVSVQPILALAAWKTNRPVRTVYTRTESMIATTKRHPSTITARYSASRDGRFQAFDMEGDFNTGVYASWGPTVANRVPVHASGPYKVPHVEARTRAIHTHLVSAGAFRGFGVPQAAIANETLIDDLALELGLDRWSIRRLNAIGPGDETATGQRLASAGLPHCLDALKPAWDRALAEAERHNAGNPRLRRGVGIACMWYGCGNTSLPNPSTMHIRLMKDGKLVFLNGAVDIGQGSTTVLTQIAAEALGLPVSAFTLVVGDTDLTADAGKTSASRQTLVSGNAARLAGENLRAAILGLANAGPNARLSLSGATLTITDGEASRSLDLAALDADDTGAVLSGAGSWDPPTTALDANGQGVPYASYGFAAQMAEVEVDSLLGTVKVTAIHAAHDVGRAVNPTLVEGQIHGGIAQGLGLALMEEFIPGRTENLHDYLIPTVGDMPPVTVYLIEDPEPLGPYGAKGVGEPALVATPPAILGAIRHAVGVRLTEVPALPHRVWAALKEQTP